MFEDGPHDPVTQLPLYCLTQHLAFVYLHARVCPKNHKPAAYISVVKFIRNGIAKLNRNTNVVADKRKAIKYPSTA